MINDFDCSKDGERTYKCCMCDSLLYFLNMRSLPVEIRTIVHYYFFPLCHTVSCGGYYMMRTKNEGLGVSVSIDQFKEEKKLVYTDHDLCTRGVGFLKPL